MNPSILLLALLAVLACVSPAPAASDAPAPALLSVRKIWDAGHHNAFTDLLRCQGRWYCTFREADDHVGGDGRIRVLESGDGERWTPIALVAEEGIDLRDPKLCVAPGQRLMLVAGGSVYRGGKKLLGRQPRVSFSGNGRDWTAPRRVLSEGEWLWRITWHDGRAYGVSYNASARTTPAAQAAAAGGPVASGSADWKLKLVTSADGIGYETVTHLDVPGHPNETTLRFLPDGELIAMVRREGGTKNGWIGVSQPPYRTWRWHETAHRFGGPNFIILPDGTMWAGSRAYSPERKATTVLARFGRELYEPVLPLPSGGDNSYPGFVWESGILWMSYYSSHEGRTSIYLAKIRIR